MLYLGHASVWFVVFFILFMRAAFRGKKGNFQIFPAMFVSGIFAGPTYIIQIVFFGG